MPANSGIVAVKKSNIQPIIKKHIPNGKNNFQDSLSSGLGLMDTIKAPNPKITKSMPKTYKSSSGQGVAQHFIFQDFNSVDEPVMKLTKWSDFYQVQIKYRIIIILKNLTNTPTPHGTRPHLRIKNRVFGGTGGLFVVLSNLTKLLPPIFIKSLKNFIF